MLSVLPRLPTVGIRARSLARARTAPDGTPSWLGAVGEWSTVAGGSLSASGVMETGAAWVIDDWGGMVVNTEGAYNGSTFLSGPLAVLWGGGHGNYSGNEYYLFGPLTADTPAYYKPRDPTSPAPTNVGEDGSGNPVARHTYSTISYRAANNKMYSIGALGIYSSGSGASTTHLLDFGQINPNSTSPWSKVADAANACDVTWLDETNGYIWGHPAAASRLLRYVISSDTYQTNIFANPTSVTGEPAGAIDPTRGIAVYTGSNYINHIDLGTGSIDSIDYYVPNTTGTAPTGNRGVCYDADNDRFAFWNGNGKQLFFLTPPGTSPYEGGNAWTWSNTTPGSGATPTSQNATGTQSRFEYVDCGSFAGYLLINRVGDSFYFYRTR